MMKKKEGLKSLFWINAIVVLLLLISTIFGSEIVSVASERSNIKPQRCVVIDAGHGGVDGGATSCTGVLESNLNLDIARRLNDLLHLIGMHTVMIRTEDVSIYTEGESIAAKKVSDLKKRVQIINDTKNAVLVSIHQNFFGDPRYSGAQVFYAKTEGSDTLAKEMQRQLVKTLNPDSNRQAKLANGIYLMKNIHCTGILIECGFISNSAEENKLRSDTYQKEICCVIASTLSSFCSRDAIT